MHAVIQPGVIQGVVAAPPSKSFTQRAYAGALLHQGKTVIHGAGHSADEQAALHMIRSLGAEVREQGSGEVEVISQGVRPISTDPDCGESGLAARLFIPIIATCASPVTLTGSGSLMRRPMHGVREALQALGVDCPGFEGRLPITIQGPLTPVSLNIDGSNGSQLLTGLLFALAATATQPLTITVSDLKSKPYIDMTLAVLQEFGMPVQNEHYETFTIDPARFLRQGDVQLHIEGDWSGAANFLVAAAIAGNNLEVQHLALDSRQADRAIIEALQSAGAYLSFMDGCVGVRPSRLYGFDFDATDCPDLFPALAVLAACADGESNIWGVERLHDKESDRAASIADLLKFFDVPFVIRGDLMNITGVRRLSGGAIDAHGDHRIAMAAAIGALKAAEPVTITGAEAVNKSYPAFFNDLSLCGVRCQLNS